MGSRKLLIFAGTTEGRLLASALSGTFQVTACAATEYGASLLRQEGKPLRVLSGRLDTSQIEALLREGFFCVVDATHPYAREVTANIRKACRDRGVPYYRLLREESDLRDAVRAADAAEAADFLAEKSGNVLLTTGSKEIEPFLRLQDWQDRLYLRALPSPENLSKCARLGIPPSHICLMQGPFSRELERGFLLHWQIRYVVMKDSGREGGTQEKLRAAQDCGVQAVVLCRPPEPDGFSLAALERLLTAERSD